METLAFMRDNVATILFLTGQHVSIVGVAVGLAILTGVPIGIAITQSKRAADVVLYVAAIIMTIPSIALFGMLIPLLSLIGSGIGYLPAVIAVLLYSQLPIIRNTYTAINNVDPALREAARGMGMKPLERLRRVELPLAVPVIMAGVRVAVVINIGITAIATYIGAGGLGIADQPRHLADRPPPARRRRALRQPPRHHRRLRPSVRRQRRLTPAGLRVLRGGPSMIRLEDLTKRFGSVRRAPTASTWRCKEGEICILLGPSGCGKTTTLKMVNRLIPQDLGPHPRRRPRHGRRSTRSRSAAAWATSSSRSASSRT